MTTARLSLSAALTVVLTATVAHAQAVIANATCTLASHQGRPGPRFRS